MRRRTREKPGVSHPNAKAFMKGRAVWAKSWPSGHREPVLPGWGPLTRGIWCQLNGSTTTGTTTGDDNHGGTVAPRGWAVISLLWRHSLTLSLLSQRRLHLSQETIPCKGGKQISPGREKKKLSIFCQWFYKLLLHWITYRCFNYW